MLKRLFDLFFSEQTDVDTPVEYDQELLISSMESDVQSAQSMGDYVQLHAISEQDLPRMRQMGTCMRIRFSAGKVVQVVEVDEFEEDPVSIRPFIKQLKWAEYTPHEMSFLVPTEDGSVSSHLGGSPPAGFTMPSSPEIASPFQYVGAIGNEATSFPLPIPALHLAYPLFVTIPGFLFLDYSDPDQPVVLDGFEVLEYPYGEWASGSIHEFKEVPIQTLPIGEVEDEDDLTFDYWNYGYAGLPNWAQYPKIPYCPKSGELMEFVCQIDTFGKIETVQSDLAFSGEYFDLYSKHLNFWGDGCLFVFMHPETKVVGYLIQNT